MTTLDQAAVDLMMATPPRDWWRFVGCALCNSPRQEPCRRGSLAWPDEAARPHAVRYRAGLSLHGVFWLLSSGFATDVVGGKRGEA